MHNNRPTVRTTVTTCSNCGTRTKPSYHDGHRCDGLVIEVDGTLQCAECGVQITPSATCPACGASATTETSQAIVSLRETVPSAEIAAALRTQVQQGYPNPLADDRDLAAIATQYVSVAAEQTAVGSATQDPSLSDRVDTYSLPVGGYQTYTLESYPNGDTATAIASELSTEFLTGFPDRDSEFTHLGIGVEWNPRGGLHVGLIAAKRLVSLPAEIDPTKLEQAIHEITNEQRTTHGHDPVMHDLHLAGIARSHSRAMATQDFFAHESPDGVTTMDRYQRAEYEGRRAGENIAKRYPAMTADTYAIATDVVSGWMDSPGHRENILTDSFDVEGIGLYQDSDGALFITQNFA